MFRSYQHELAALGRPGFLLERLELFWFGTPGAVLESIGVSMERPGSIIFGTVLGRLVGVLEPSWSVLKTSKVVLRLS